MTSILVIWLVELASSTNQMTEMYYIDAWRVAKATVLTLFYYTVDLAGNAGDNSGP